MLDQIDNTTGSAPTLAIYTGSEPAIGSAVTGTLLVSMTLPSTWMNAASSGSVTKAGTWTNTAVAGGIPGYFRISQGSTGHIQGTVGTSGTDMIINASPINLGATVTVTSFTINAPNA